MYDTKYIETLLDKYWDAQTSNEEEALLNEYFSKQEILPQSLQYAQPFFSNKRVHVSTLIQAKNNVLNDEFDAQILKIIANDEINEKPKSKIRNWRYGITSTAAVLVMSVGLILWYNQQRIPSNSRKMQTINLTNIQPVNRNNVVLNTYSKNAVNIAPKSNIKKPLYAATLVNKQNFKKLKTSTVAKSGIENHLAIKDTYKNPADAQKCLDSVLAVVSQKYNQGFDVIVEQTTDLELLKNPFKKIKNINKDEKPN